jgi:hypothetical protein
MPNDFTHKLPIEFICTHCSFNCGNKKDYNRHILTRKHLILTNPNDFTPKTHDCICGKSYKHYSSLCNHKKTCIQPAPKATEPTPSQDDEPIPTNIILELIKQNQEFKQLLVEQNKQLYEKHEENMGLQKQLLDVVKDGKTINNNNTIHSNSHNKTFNLQVFLNETCKDAMNIKDFIQSLELTLTDLEKVGELGYAEGISRLFIKGLNNLDITKRPIHCSDVKREIMHIKHEDKWEKDNANQDKLRNIIKQLTHKNIMMLDDWKKANPGCTAYDSRKYDHYLKLTMESMGPTDEDAEKRDFNKIIRRVAENTTIDKKYLMV